MAVKILEKSCEKDTPVLFIPKTSPKGRATQEGRDVLSHVWKSHLDIEFYFSDVEKKPILLANDNKYIGSGKIISYLLSLRENKQ